MKTLVVFLLISLVLAVPAFGQDSIKDVAAFNHPLFETTMSSVGFNALYPATAYSQVNVVSKLQVKAITAASFNIWTYDGTTAINGNWSMISPSFVLSLADTVLTLSAGESEAYYFQTSRPKAIYLRSGSIKVKGE